MGRDERRASGKSDTIDAEHAAHTVLPGRGTATQKLADGPIEAIRLVEITRDTAVKAHTTAIATLNATLVTASDELRGELDPLSDYQLVTACAVLDISGDMTNPDTAMRYTLVTHASRWLTLHDEIQTHTAHLKTLTKTAARQMLERFGIGFGTTAELLITTGDDQDRIRPEAASAKMCGVCPIPTGLGKTSGRHHLNRRGNRQTNAALCRVVIARKRWHPPVIAYVQRRTAEGLSEKDIIRYLKRYVAREIYHPFPEPRAEADGLPKAA